MWRSTCPRVGRPFVSTLVGVSITRVKPVADHQQLGGQLMGLRGLMNGKWSFKRRVDGRYY